MTILLTHHDDHQKQRQQRTGLGRKKIAIERIERSENRKVTFSKRRGGLFKKASEICITCGAQIAVVVFSQAGRLFTFGSPSVHAVVNRFHPQQDGGDRERDRGDDVGVLNLFTRQQEELKVMLEAEKRRGELLQRMLKRKQEWGATSGSPFYWCDETVEMLGKDQLQDTKVALGILKGKVEKKLDDYDHFLTLRL